MKKVFFKGMGFGFFVVGLAMIGDAFAGKAAVNIGGLPSQPLQGRAVVNQSSARTRAPATVSVPRPPGSVRR